MGGESGRLNLPGQISALQCNGDLSSSKRDIYLDYIHVNFLFGNFFVQMYAFAACT